MQTENPNQPDEPRSPEQHDEPPIPDLDIDPSEATTEKIRGGAGDQEANSEKIRR